MQIGITERGDAGLDLSWQDKLYPLNILITKHPNDEFIKAVIPHKDKVIIHITCTGYGGTKLEPNVPEPDTIYDQAEKLISMGFPVEQLVLRIDPIVPTSIGLNRVILVAEHFTYLGIPRLRYSFIDMYPHVKRRFTEAKLKLPFKTFQAPGPLTRNAIDLMTPLESYYELESCAEHTSHQVGCISQKDLTIMGIESDAQPLGMQRPSCLCLASKVELLTEKKRCAHGCLYCYWKD